MSIELRISLLPHFFKSPRVLPCVRVIPPGVIQLVRRMEQLWMPGHISQAQRWDKCLSILPFRLFGGVDYQS